jgi:uncharacterized protein (TIGR02996 family)
MWWRRSGPANPWRSDDVGKTTARITPPEPPCLYRGAETCDFRPQWADSDGELVALLEACHAADPDELTPQLVLADWLAERSDPRERWVRVACDLWRACGALNPGRQGWDYNAAKATLAPVCETAVGWRLSCLWGHLVAWHAPTGWGTKPMGRTWVDARVSAVSRSVYWWALGFLSQADAAWRQASAAWRQASAAWRQAFAAGSQADAAGSQADAAGSQADAAGSQAYAAGNQADAAERQKLVWRFARSAWELCAAKLPLLEVKA